MGNIRQIARLAGVSRTTVSRALRNDPCVTAQTREKITAIARKLDYTPPQQSRRQFREGKVIGYLIHEHFGVVATDILRGATEEARRMKCGILMMQVPPDQAWIEEAIHNLLDMGISGLVLAHSCQTPLPRRILIMLRSRGIHVVQVMNKMFKEPLDSSCRSEREYARVVAAHYAAIGHRQVLGLGMTQVETWQAQFALHGIEATFIEFAAGAAKTQQAFESFLRMTPRPTACVFAKDNDAYRFSLLAKLHGLRIPGDLSILGMGNFGADWYPEISTVDIQSQEMGRAGIRLLAQRMAEGIPPHEIAAFHDITWPAQVIDRGSTGPPLSCDAGGEERMP